MTSSATVALPCAGCAGRLRRNDEAFVWGTDQRQRVTTTTAVPYRYICNLEYNGASIGTGTLIGPRTVLTAGHCIHDSAGRLRIPAQMRIIPGRNGALEPLPATRAARFLPLPRYARATQTDVGVIHLVNPVGTQTGWWHQTNTRSALDPVGTSMSSQLARPAGTLSVNVSGYPADMPADRSLGCRDSSGAPCAYSRGPGRNLARCGTEQWRAYDRTVRVVGGLLAYRTDTCAGHSGSPVWVRRHPSAGGRVLVGVHIRQGPGVGVNAAVQLTPALLTWIRGNTR